MDSKRTRNQLDSPYEAPELTVIGYASEVVLGVAGGGFDGRVGMTEPDFEFQPDDELNS